jgi:hypothetical protein
MKTNTVARILIALAFAACAIPAQARDTRPYDGFRTGQCKSSSCYSKHPGGTYVYPNHYGRRKS